MTYPPHQHNAHKLLPVPFAATTAPGILLQSGDLWLGGWSLTEASGAAVAAVQLFDGNDANGVPASGVINLAISGDRFGNFGGHFLVLQSGLFVKVVAGSVSGVVYLADR